MYPLYYMSIVLCIHYAIHSFVPLLPHMFIYYFLICSKKKAKIFSGNFLGIWLCLSGKQPFFIWKRPLLIHYNAPICPLYAPNYIDKLI